MHVGRLLLTLFVALPIYALIAWVCIYLTFYRYQYVPSAVYGIDAIAGIFILLGVVGSLRGLAKRR